MRQRIAALPSPWSMAGVCARVPWCNEGASYLAINWLRRFQLGDYPREGLKADDTWPWRPAAFLFGCLTAALFVAAFWLPPKGDEILVYETVLRESIRAWPGANTWEVHYGISPLYLWAVGGLGTLIHLPPVTVGRLVSLAFYSLALVGCFRGGSLRYPGVGLILIHPFLLTYAVRANPYVPALGVLWAGIRWLPRTTGWLAFTSAVSSNLQNLLLPATGTLGLLLRTRLSQRIAGAAVLTAAALGGIVVNWLFYGGRFPAAFIASHWYEPYRHFSGFNIEYVALGFGCCGFLVAVVGNRPVALRLATPLALLGMVVALATIHAELPAGPLASAAHRLGRYAVPVYTLGIGLGWAGLARAGTGALALIVGSLVAVLEICTLPWIFERYAWFAVIPVLIVWLGTGDQQPRWSRLYGLYAGSMVILGALYLRFGSL